MHLPQTGIIRLQHCLPCGIALFSSMLVIITKIKALIGQHSSQPDAPAFVLDKQYRRQYRNLDFCVTGKQQVGGRNAEISNQQL